MTVDILLPQVRAVRQPQKPEYEHCRVELPAAKTVAVATAHLCIQSHEADAPTPNTKQVTDKAVEALITYSLLLHNVHPGSIFSSPFTLSTTLSNLSLVLLQTFFKHTGKHISYFREEKNRVLALGLQSPWASTLPSSTTHHQNGITSTMRSHLIQRRFLKLARSRRRHLGGCLMARCSLSMRIQIAISCCHMAMLETASRQWVRALG
jgi:hypothetical protein